MATKARKTQKTDQITRGDLRLLLSAALFLGAVVLKTSGAPLAGQVRTQMVSALRGGISTEEVLQVAGQTFENGGLATVFADWQKTVKEKQDSPSNTAQAPDNAAQSEVDEQVTEVYAETSFPEDTLESRIASNFPKEADDTAYMMSFATHSPVKGVRTSEFGMRTHPISGKESFHYGLDIGAPEGTPIEAFADGTVREIGSSTYGNYIVVDHAEGISTLYAHCHEILAKKGDQVTAGDTIATVGATGNATGNHLHLEVWRAGKALDPANYISV